jgi:Mn2+/Fe2+ NRAMP family transporter
LAVLGVISTGFVPDSSNVTASVFRQAAGDFGFKIFGIILWCAAITSVIGAAYTSISFLKTFHPNFEKKQRWIVGFFIIFSTIVFIFVGNPSQVLIFAGTCNGYILPFALSIMLISLRKKSIFKEYKHPLLLQICGWLVVIAMSIFALKIL